VRLLHFRIQLATLRAIGFNFGQPLDIGPHNQSESVLLGLLVGGEQIIEQHELVEQLAVRVVAELEMFGHLCDDPGPLLLDEADVLLVALLVLLAPQLVLDLLHGVGSYAAQLVLGLLLDVFVVAGYLGQLVLFLLFHHLISLDYKNRGRITHGKSD